MLHIRILLVKVDSVQASDLCGEDPAFLGSHGASNNGIIAIEVLGDLLKWSVAGLNVKEVDDRKLDCQPRAVDDVVLPEMMSVIGLVVVSVD